MAFNWFRRQSTSEDVTDPPANQTDTDLESPVADISPVEDATVDIEADPEDYLAWAKAALQSVQERQKMDEPTLTAIPAPSDDVAPSPVLESEVVDPDVQVPEPEPEPPPVLDPAPVMAQKETTPAAPDLSIPSRTEVGTETEGFRWSAEVLIAQGRSPEDISPDEISWLKKLRQGLTKTRRGVVNRIKAIVGKGPLDQDAVVEIETLLLQADVGVAATDHIIEALQAKMRQETLPPDAAIAYLKSILQDILDAPLRSQYSPVFSPVKGTLNIWLMTGVNGAGKTTTIGKLAHIAKASGYTCLVAAADTFRAAAVEQVKIWAQRSGIEVIANPGQNTDPASVVFDAITAAQSRQTELLLVDTAGRLQNKKNLMDELSKVRQIIQRKAPDAKVESLLVLDATLGQNGLRQAQVFSESAQLSGVVLTKLDGTAKG
ncbi:MAG: signal recognition particle-docking protein FtsY, partial [Thermosynechococcaceae cyanobacterium]